VRILLTLLISLAVIGSAIPAFAQAQQDGRRETVYATDHHMWFSIRVTLIRLLGGRPVVREHDVDAAEKDRWWGEPVPTRPEATRDTR